jgi:putative transposase
MVTILSAVVSIFVFRFRSRASLELKLIALQHQLSVLHRQRPGRPQLSSLDRLLWVWLYRIWPQVIDAMILVKPATVVQWHRMQAALATATCPPFGSLRPTTPRARGYG